MKSIPQALAFLLSCSVGVSLADAQVTANGPDAAFKTPTGTSTTTGQPQPLMGLLEQTPFGQALEAANIRLYGHLEGSYTYNFDNPAKDLNNGRVFDSRNDRVIMNQADFNIERPVDLTKLQWDVGGHIEALYGTDAVFIHSNGLLDHESGEYQLDVPQAYVDVAVPVGNGLRVRAGKFLFFKQIDPNASVFYSHSFSFGAALPFTLTGVTGYYPITKQLSIEAGISRGWDQSIRDNNGAIDGLFRVRDDLTDRLSLSLAGIIGPELNHDNRHYRGALDFTINFAATNQLTLLLDAVLGTQARAGVGDADWYGISGYAVCQINDYLAAGVRLEWYRDEAGFTTAVSQTLYEATIGLTLTPFPHDPVGSNLKIRPELRADYASSRYFDGLSRHDQYTVAVDAIFNF